MKSQQKEQHLRWKVLWEASGIGFLVGQGLVGPTFSVPLAHVLGARPSFQNQT